MKKIMFLNTTKLASISVGLLLVIFCTIGMSFTRVDEGGVEDANDSTSVSIPKGGPRKSHWTEPGVCGGTNYKNKKDYGKVIVTVVGGTGGTVSASGTNSTSSTANNNSTSVTVTWNCGYDDSSNHTDLAAKHTNSITYTANPASGYQLEGWYTDEECTTLVSNNPEDFVIGHSSYEGSQNNEYEGANKAQTWNRYAKFVKDEPVDLTFIAPGAGGSYTVTVSGSSSTVSSANVVKTGITTEVSLVATPASGYMFAGWYQIDEGNVGDLSTDASYNKKFAKSVSVGARFISTSTPKFKNITKNVEYYGLRQATLAASAGDKIIPMADCAVDGSDLVSGESYTIPAGVILLIPFDANNTCYTTAPDKVNPAAGAPGPYRTLTLAEGVKINVEGAISVSAKQYGTGTTAGQSGVRDKYGFIDMNAGSEIILKNGANLYAWGYISGDGEITAKDGAIIYEMFQITDFRGGNATSNIEGNSYKVFPFSQYYIQNIEATLHVEYGATEIVRALIAMSSSTYPGTATLIGKSSALFTMSSGCVLTKKYNRLTDRLHYTLNGNATLSALKLSISGLPLIGTLNLDTKDYVLPLNGGMSINIESNKTLTVSQDLAILPGAEVNIATGAKMVLSSGFNIYAYDEADWKGKNYVYSGVDVKPLPYVARNHVNVAGAPKPRSLGDDAKFVVDGGIEVTGGFYTTTGGADICSSGTGFFKFVTNAAPANKNTYQVYQEGNQVSSWPAIPVTSAQLHNADGSYTTTSGVPANTTINYKHGHWGWKVIWRLEDGTPMKTAYFYKEPDDTWISNNKPSETHPDAGTSSCTYAFNGWTKTTTSANQEIEMVASFTRTCPNYYEVTWKSEDGSATLETDPSVGEGEATHYNGDALTKATDWTNYYVYDFDGWTTGPIGTGTFYAAGSTPAATADVTYYAHFKATGMEASVTEPGKTPEIYMTIQEAFDVAVTKPTSTITVLHDVSGITKSLVYDNPNGICTLDLNNHTVSGVVPYTSDKIIGGLIVINASGANFTITDNSGAKNGRIENIKAQNQVTYGVLVTAGTLDVDTGTVYVENPAQYASKAATVNSVAVTALTSCGARAVQVAAGQTFNFKKGLLEAHATRNAYGIVATGNTANTTKVTLTGGKVYAEAPCGAYGISCTGKLDMSAGLVEAKLNDHLVDASYTATDASNNLNKHQSCYGIIMNGYANATASSCYFGTLTITGGKIKASSDLIRSYTSNVYGVYMNYKVAGLGNRNYASTSKTNAEQACSKGSIKNATIEVQNNANAGYGIIVLGKYNSKDKSNTTIIVENTNVSVKANNNAYGIYSSGAIDGTTGECSTGDVELTNNTVYAEAEKGSGAYATWVWASYTTIYKDKQANYYGEYAAGAKMTINSGTYTAKTKTSTAYATGTSLRAKSIYDPTISTEAERTPGEGKEAFATLIINGGTFNAEATTTTARGVSSGGNTTIKDATFNVVAGTYQAYGLYAQSGKLTATNVIVNDTAKGRYSASNDDAYAYGAMADISTIGSGNQAWTGYTCAGEIELNNCTINAVASTYRSARGVMVNAGSVMMTRANFEAQKTSSSWTTATYNAYNSVFPVQVQGKDSIWIGIAAKATINGGTFTVRTKTTSAYGAFNTRALKYSYTKPNTILEEFQGTLDINNATFDVQTEGTTTAEGVRSYGQTTITGGSFTVQPKSTTAYGIKVYSGKTTVNGNPTFTVKATKTACGIIAGGGEAPHTKLGYGYDGEVEVNGGTFNVETTEDKPAYGVLVYANSTPITSTAAGYYAGNYASAGKATINDGVFNVKSKKTEAYGIYMNPAVSQSGATGYAPATATPVCEVNGGTFTAEGTTDIAYGAYVSNGATLTVTDGTFKGKLTAVGAEKYAVGAYIAAGGILDATGGSFEAEAAKSGLSSKQKAYACGLYAPSGASSISASNATFKGELKSTYLTKGEASEWTGGAYGVYACSTNPLTLTNCTIIGNSAYQAAFGLRFSNTPAEVRNCTVNVTTTKAYNYGLFVGGATCDVKLYDCSFTCTSGTTYAYGIYAYNGATYAENCSIDATVQRTGASSAADSYLYGVLVASGKTATLNGCTITATGSGKYSNNGYGVYVDGTANLDDCTVTVSNINSGAYALFNTSNTTLLNVASGKYKATATTNAASTNGTAAAAKQTLNGGYYSHDANLSKYAVLPKKVITLRESHTLYPDYKYTINEGGTVKWMDGTSSTPIKTEMYESGETPAYTGDAPTKDADASYTYTHNGWTPAVSAMANSDVTYTATFSQTEKKYSVSVVAGANGSVSPASVNNIGCETASGDISATPNTGYQFAGWTLPAGVTAASGYTVNSNPIHIHATAVGTMTANFAAKTYEVTLDNQSATTAGQTNVTATYNAAMPSIAASLPAKIGYAFGGYYSEVDGGGTQYYNADGTSAHIWDIDAATTLYAKWTQNSIGPELDIIDWTDDAVNGKTLKLNLNGIPAAGWPYEINGTSYASNQRDADRTLTIPYIGSADQSFAIVVKKTGGDVYSSHTYTIPHVDNFTGVKEYSVVYVNSGTVTVSSDATVNAVYVAPGAELVVSNGVTLTVDSIMLRTTPWEAAILDNQGTIVVPVGKAYYTRIIADNSKYYQFAIPLSSNVKNVRLSNGAKCTYNTSWMLKSYEEALRAKNGPINDVDHSNWKLLTTEEGQNKDNGVVAASKGYEMFSNTPYYREYYFPVTLPTTKTTQVAVTCTKPDGKTEQWYEANSGWNALCSPLLGKYVQDFGTHPEDGLKVSELLSDGHYWQHPSNVIYPAVPFYYQAPQTGVLHFDSKMTIANNAPRRAWNTSIPTQWMQLTIQNQYGDKLDETSIYTHPEKFVVDYESGYDVMKQSLEGGKALLYSELPCGKLAFAAVPDSLAETRIPLTVYAAAEGEYIFSMIENDYLGRLQYVLLHDTQTGLVTDLLERDCAADLAQGTNAGRFYLQCVFAAEAPEVSTGVNHIKSEKDKAQKILYNDKVYIIYQGRVYDMTGRQCELR